MYYFDAASPQTIQRGSLIFCDSPDIMGSVIRFAQLLRWRAAAQFNHVAIARESGTNPSVIQASINGVTGTQHLTDLEGGKICIVPPPIGFNVDWIIEFAESQLSDDYGWLTLFGEALSILSPSWLQFQVGRDSTWICSSLVAEAWRCGGFIHNWGSIYSVAPAQLAIAVGVGEIEVFPGLKNVDTSSRRYRKISTLKKGAPHG